MCLPIEWFYRWVCAFGKRFFLADDDDRWCVTHYPYRLRCRRGEYRVADLAYVKSVPVDQRVVYQQYRPRNLLWVTMWMFAGLVQWVECRKSLMSAWWLSEVFVLESKWSEKSKSSELCVFPSFVKQRWLKSSHSHISALVVSLYPLRVIWPFILNVRGK